MGSRLKTRCLDLNGALVCVMLFQMKIFSDGLTMLMWIFVSPCGTGSVFGVLELFSTLRFKLAKNVPEKY